MKINFLYLLLSLLSLISLAICVIIGYQCSDEDIAVNNCTGDKECLYINPVDCGSFVQCNRYSQAFVIYCANDTDGERLHWNDETKQCDYHFYECQQFDGCPDDCSGDDCLYSDPQNCANYFQCYPSVNGSQAASQAFSCDEGLEFSNDVKDCLPPDEANCTVTAPVETP